MTDAPLFAPAPPHSAAPRLTARGITKRFPGCLANDRVDLTLGAGRIQALLGENGAGKSTLVKMIYGVLQPDSGTFDWDGAPTVLPSPQAARRLGIGMVFQHFSLFDTLTAAENVALGLDAKEPMKALSDRIAAVSARYGLALDPGRPVHALSVGERQRVEIVRCLLQKPRLLIMDEPTSVLTPQEADRLFDVLRQLAGEGCSVLYISHKLDEIRALCDDATVMRAGKVVAHCDPRAETARSLAEMMIGASLPPALRAPSPSAAAQAAAAEPRLEVRRLSTLDDNPFAVCLKDVSLTVRAGEIVGVAGVAGNGQAELLAALSGETLTAPDCVLIDGKPAGHLGPRRRRNLGLGFVPEERLGRGAAPELSLAENALLSAHARLGMVRRGVVRGGKARAFADRVIDVFNVAARGHHSEARSLSGGNLQKFIIGREVLQNPGLLVIGQPTWGVDAGAAAAIHRALIELAHGGAAVLAVSQDLDELFTLSDRIAVLFDGRLSPARPTHKTSVDEIGLAMGGAVGDGAFGDAD